MTDHDAGVEDDPSVEPVTQDQVFAAFERSIGAVRSILVATIAGAAVEA